MKIRGGGRAVPFVEKENRARLYPSHDAGRDRRRILTHGIESAHGPADQLQVAPGEREMNEEIFHAGRRAKKARSEVTPIDLRGDARGRQAPKRSAWMRERVVRHFVPRDTNCF